MASAGLNKTYQKALQWIEDELAEGPSTKIYLQYGLMKNFGLSERWLDKQLDTLTKIGKVIVTREGRYAHAKYSDHP